MAMFLNSRATTFGQLARLTMISSALAIAVGLAGCNHTAQATDSSASAASLPRNAAPPPDAEAKALAGVDSSIAPVPANLPPDQEAQAQMARAQAVQNAKAQITHSFQEMSDGANGMTTHSGAPGSAGGSSGG